MAGGRKAVGAAALLCVLAVTGCTAEAGTPAPSVSSPPAPSASPTETEQERQERLDYAAAEKAYRTFRREYGRVLRAGGAKKPTKVMRATAGGEYLETFSRVIRGYRELGSREVGREKIVYVHHGGYAADVVRLDVCEDSSDTRTVRRNGQTVKGEVRTAALEVRQVSGSWKVWSGSGKLVRSCE